MSQYIVTVVKHDASYLAEAAAEANDGYECSVRGAPLSGGAPFLMSGTALMLRGRGRPERV